MRSTGGSVELSASGVGPLLEIAIRDSAGIPPECLPHVFERVRQGDVGTRRRFGGFGLGLPIVRHLVELHGGTVAAESSGEGTESTFRVLLPMPQREAERPGGAAGQTA